MKWYEVLVLGFIGAMIFTWAKMRNAHFVAGATAGAYPATTAPVQHDSLMLSFGFINEVCAPARNELVRNPMETKICYAPLAADYLCNAPGHAAAIAPMNLGDDPNTSQINDWDICRVPAQATIPIGVRGPNVAPRPVKIPQSVCCNPDIPTYVPSTEVI